MGSAQLQLVGLLRFLAGSILGFFMAVIASIGAFAPPVTSTSLVIGLARAAGGSVVGNFVAQYFTAHLDKRRNPAFARGTFLLLLLGSASSFFGLCAILSHSWLTDAVIEFGFELAISFAALSLLCAIAGAICVAHPTGQKRKY